MMQTLQFSEEEVLKLLEKSKLGKYLNADELKYLITLSSLEKYDEGEIIIQENSLDHNLFFILKNSVSVEVETDKKSVYIDTIGEGELFGEAGIFVNTKRTASIIAKDEVILLRIERANFMKEINSNPKAGIKVLFLIVYSLLSKLRSVNEELAYERKDDTCQDDIDLLIQTMMPEENAAIFKQ